MNFYVWVIYESKPDLEVGHHTNLGDAINQAHHAAESFGLFSLHGPTDVTALVVRDCRNYPLATFSTLHYARLARLQAAATDFPSAVSESKVEVWYVHDFINGCLSDCVLGPHLSQSEARYSAQSMIDDYRASGWNVEPRYVGVDGETWQVSRADDLPRLISIELTTRTQGEYEAEMIGL